MEPPRVSLLVPDMPSAEELQPFLRRIDSQRWYTNFGPLVREFEAALARELQAMSASATAPRLVSTANCTLGLELALSALGLERGARVLVPAFTFVATATAVLRAGLTPVLADVDPASWVLTPDLARAGLAAAPVDAVMPVATFGCPQDVAGWDAFARRTGLPVVVDAAGAFGNQPIGEAAVVVFSFHATKSLGIGEGGAVVARDDALVERVRQLTNFGIELPSGIVRHAGTNAKLSEYHAAVGLAALARWPQAARLRRAACADYLARLARHCPEVGVQCRPAEGVYTIFPVLLPEGTDAGRLRSELEHSGIETRLWYQPLVGDHPGIGPLASAAGLEGARRLAGRVLGLPFHLQMGDGERERVCARLGALLPQRSSKLRA
jgi:dTDP-4-amino-4,6-dideoxygalactose transaminase